MKQTPIFSYARLTSAIIGLCAISALACQQGGGATSIFALPTLGGSGVQVNALNAAGQITGFSDTSNNVATHAFFYGANVLVDIGTFGGDLSQGLALNGAGTVVGDADVNTSSFHAFSYDRTNLLDLGTLGGSFSSATAINDAGQIVGNSTTGDGFQQAFLFQNGSITNLSDLGGGTSSATAINQNGIVAGDSFNLNSDNHAVIWTNGTIVDLGTLGGSDSRSFRINNSNVVIGESSTAAGETHGFVYSSGVMSDVGTLGGSFSTTRGINDAGVAIGNSTTEFDAEFHAFIYNGSMTDLGTLGGTDAEASAINNLGQVVGQSTLTNGTPHAFLWQNGTMTDLNDALPANSGWELFSADFINDSSRIVGFGSYNGNFMVFVLDLGGVSNNPPLANAGTNQTVECASQVTLDGTASSDPDGDVLTYQWSEGNVILGTAATLNVSLPLGVHTISLQVSDPCGAASQANVQVSLVDTTAPVIVSGPAIPTLSAGTQCQAAVPSVVAQIVATDNCTQIHQLTITQDPAAGTLVGVGLHTIIVTVTDASSNSTAGSLSYTVADTTAPVITSVSAPISLSAGAGCSAAAPDVVSSVVASDNCTPPNQLSISQSPAAGTLLSVGQSTITVTVTDASGNHSSASVLVTVSDTTAPSITSLSGQLNVMVGANCQGAVPNVIGSVVASDNCTPANQLVITQSPAAGTLLTAGQYSITVTVTDATGNHTSATVPLVVADTTAPVIQSITANPNVLSPANGKLIPVTVSVSSTDNCDASPVSKIVSVSCNETVAPGDINITGNLTVSLAASRNSMSLGRIYTISVQCTDASGNSTMGTVLVTVPKGNGKKP